MVTLSAPLLRLALIAYRSERLSLGREFPQTYNPDQIRELDAAIGELEGNISRATVTAAACSVAP